MLLCEVIGCGYKKITEELECAMMPLTTIKETDGGVMAIIQRKTVNEIIAERAKMSETLSVTSRTIERDLSAMQKVGS